MRKTAADFPQELLELYDFYVHGQLSKRGFLAGAAKFAVAGMTATALLEQLQPNYAWAAQVDEQDPTLSATRVRFKSPKGNGTMNGYLVSPAERTGPLPGVLVVHENRGLNPYIEDVARRMAKAGFVALAPDGLSSVGGYPGNDDEGRVLQRKVDRSKLLNDFFAAFEWLQSHEHTTDKVGAVGFCYGGGVVNALAVAYPELAAGVPFYGRQAPAADVPAIEAPLLIQYAELDRRVNEGWPAFKAALRSAGKNFTMHMYRGVNHGFHNDTTPRYDASAGRLAEQRTVEFFRRHLS